MTKLQLGEILREMKNSTNSPTMIHLFGIRYAKEIVESGATNAELIKIARLQESYVTELNKGRALAKYVVDKEKLKELL
jgi:uncharacterized HAD superfamily protein